MDKPQSARFANAHAGRCEMNQYLEKGLGYANGEKPVFVGGGSRVDRVREQQP
jgi:hypothetical protein